jgi:AbrB family looped-hinge helix DNA binding protein
MAEVSVSKKGQITIPAKIRRKLKIEKGTKLAVTEEKDKIIMEKLPSIFDLAGCGGGKISVEEVKKMLDEMRAEDDD